MNIGINQKPSPIKFCFFIRPNRKSSFEKAINIAFSLWGGTYSPILPLYKRMPESYKKEYKILVETKTYYRNTINNFDPDIILYDSDLDIEYIAKIIGERQSIKIDDFNLEINNIENRIGINLIQLLSSVINSEFKFKRNDDLKIFLPDTKDASLFVKSFFGSIPLNVKNLINEQLVGKPFFDNPKLSLENCHTHYPNGNISLLELNLFKINSRPDKVWNRGIAIFFLDENRLNDINNFWNLRALGWHIVPMPMGQIDNEYFDGYCERFILHQIENSNGVPFISYLISYSTTIAQKNSIDAKLVNLKERIDSNYHFEFRGWFPRFWEERSILEADKARCENISSGYDYQQVEHKDNYVSFSLKKLPFEVRYSNNAFSSYKVNLSFSYLNDYANQAGLIYGISSSDWSKITHSYRRDRWRICNSGLTYLVAGIDEKLGFFIPNSLDFFKIYFSNRRFKLKDTPNAQLANEVLKNIGGVRGLYFIKNKSVLQIIQLFEDGKLVTYSQLVAEIKKNLGTNKNPEVEEFLKVLLENKIIEFGAKVQCTVCKQRSFFLTNELDENIVCSVCRNVFHLPIHAPKNIEWSYRGIGPFSKNNKVGGIISVFLTLKLFNSEFAEMSGNISSIMGFELERKPSILMEVDLAVMLQEKYDKSIPPDLLLCECKTFKDFTSKDCKRMIALGEEFPSSILTFSTLKDELAADEKEEIKKVVLHFRNGVGNRPKNPVLVLTANELIPEGFNGHFKSYEDEIHPSMRYNDWIGTLCELSIKRNLGLDTWGEIRTEQWLAEVKERNEQKLNSIE